MWSSILKIFAAVATFITSPRRERERREKEKGELSKAVHEGDKDKVNDYLNKTLLLAVGA